MLSRGYKKIKESKKKKKDKDKNKIFLKNQTY
jgi:hypothetical protein